MKISITSIMFVFFCLSANVNAQEEISFPSTEKEYNETYKSNIKKLKINGVYIPGSEEEAFKEITLLSEEGAWEKFQSGPEDLVVKNLKLGLGRWMVVNWNFYEGSRMSHYLKKKGLMHPEDMGSYLLRYFHRKLNKVPIEEEAIIQGLNEARRKKLQKELIDTPIDNKF